MYTNTQEVDGFELLENRNTNHSKVFLNFCKTVGLSVILSTV